jgi:prophage antirepressor-like protein
MEQIQLLNYEDIVVRTIERNGEIWWVLKDVCDVLEISNPTVVAERLDDDEVTKFDLGGLSGISNIISESGLYSVILRSDKPKAKPFRKWVTSEVLPSIRKTGAYSMITEPEQSPVIKRIQAMESMIADYWRANDEQYMKLRQEVSQARFEQLRDSFREFKGKIWLEGVPPELLERIDNVFMEWSKV